MHYEIVFPGTCVCVIFFLRGLDTVMLAAYLQDVLFFKILPFTPTPSKFKWSTPKKCKQLGVYRLLHVVFVEQGELETSGKFEKGSGCSPGWSE